MPTAIDHPSVRRVRAALTGLGCADTIRLLPDSARTAAAAAAAREADVDRKHWRELLKKHGLYEGGDE